MAGDKYGIPSHLDDPELIGLWTLDEFLAMVIPFTWGILWTCNGFAPVT